MHFRKVWMGICAAAILNTVASSSPSFASEAVRIGTSSVGSTFYILANGLSALLYKHAKINVSVEPVGGSVASVFGLSVGNIDYAVTNSGAAFTAYRGQAPFKKPIDISLIAQGEASYRFIVVRRDAKIAKVADLEGHIMIGKRPAMPEIGEISSALVKSAGLGASQVNIVSTAETSATVNQLTLGTVQAAIIPGGAHVPSVVQLFRNHITDHLYLTDGEIAAMKKQLPPYMFAHVLPRGHFIGQEKPATVFGLNTYLVAGPKATEEQVYAMTKALFENQAEFATYHRAAKEWTLKNTLLNFSVPFHAGAVRYFKEKGVWTPELQARQTELLAQR